MKNIKFIATDMDNTLLTSRGELPPNFMTTISQLLAADVAFAAASGRPLYTLLEMFGEFRDQMTFVCDNGGLIMHKGEIIFNSERPQKDYQQMVTFAKETDAIAIICGLDAAYIAQKDEQYDAIYRTFYKKIVYVDDLEDLNVTADKFTLYFPNNNSQEKYHSVFAPQFGENYSVVVSGPEWIDIMNQGVDKGTAMEILSQKLGIALADMMAFGDTHNDVGMLKTVGHSYLVANGNPEIAKYAEKTAPSNDEYGVQQILEQVLTAKENLFETH